jgi:hypothetical protein
MGFAVIESANLQGREAASSALERIQLRLITSGEVLAAELKSAINDDLVASALINLTILTKALSSRRVNINRAEIESIALMIRDAMTGLPLGEATLFINYAQASVICVRASESRR